MGLIARAISLRHLALKPKGLLHKGLEIIKCLERERKKSSSFLITQDELDTITASLQSNRKDQIPVIREELSHPQIPLTWEEAGIKSPSKSLGPTIITEELQQLFSGQAGAEEKSEKKEDLIKKEISGLQDGIEAPAQLFSILKNNLGFSKAALLLYDPLRMVFAPWASCGYDKTTLHRLRIPLGYNKIFNQVANGDLLILSAKEELAGFKKCFSSREFAILSNIIFAPFIVTEKLIAVLVITNSEPPGTGDDTALLSRISAHAAPIIHRAREEKLKDLKQESASSPESLQDHVRTLAETCKQQGTPFIIIKISLERVIKSIVHNNPYLDSFRLREDILNLMRSFLADIGSIRNLNQHHLLLLIYAMPEADAELLIYQIGLAFRKFFRELASEQKIYFNEAYKVFPDDREEVLELLSELV